jgi:hypothetical protein
LKFSVGLVLDPVSPDKDERENAELASVVVKIAEQGPNNKEPPKRKRETFIQTNWKS